MCDGSVSTLPVVPDAYEVGQLGYPSFNTEESSFLLACVACCFHELTLLLFPLLELTPAAFTAYEGQEVNFTCGVTGAEVVIWRLNGVAVTTDFASLELALPVDVRIAGTLVAVILTVPATLARNGFTIQCIGFPSVSSSSNSTLQVQGWSYTPTLVIWSVINLIVQTSVIEIACCL